MTEYEELLAEHKKLQEKCEQIERKLSIFRTISYLSIVMFCIFGFLAWFGSKSENPLPVESTQQEESIQNSISDNVAHSTSQEEKEVSFGEISVKRPASCKMITLDMKMAYSSYVDSQMSDGDASSSANEMIGYYVQKFSKVATYSGGKFTKLFKDFYQNASNNDSSSFENWFESNCHQK